MITGERQQWQGQLWSQAADLEPAGRPRPCGKSSDAELVSGGEEEEQHPHPSISPMGLIWEQIGGGMVSALPDEGSFRQLQAGRGCLDLRNRPRLGFIRGFPCWVISSTRQVWTAQEGREQGAVSSCRFKFNQQVFCTFGLFYVL